MPEAAQQMIDALAKDKAAEVNGSDVADEIVSATVHAFESELRRAMNLAENVKTLRK